MPPSAGRDEADAVVIGAGIAGAASAYYLAKRGLRVVLAEQGEIACEQSSRAWGFVRQQGRDPAEIPLAQAASRMWGELAGELQADLGFVRGGILALAETEDDVKKLEDGARVAKDFGLSTRLVDKAEMARIVPELRGPWVVGLYTPDDGHAEPEKATRAFADAAQRLGAEVRCRTRIDEVLVHNGRVGGVRAGDDVLSTGVVVCAAGIYSSRFAEALGVALPCQVTRSTVAETKSASPFTRTAIWGPYVASRPIDGGGFYLGNGYRGTGADYDITLSSFRYLGHFLPSYRNNWRRLRPVFGRAFFEDIARRTGRAATLPEPRPNPAKVAHNARRFYELFPHLAGLGVRRVWAGRIDHTPDLIPVIGGVETTAGFFLATGFSGHGFALGPIVGRLIAELAVDGKTSLDLSAFDPHRFTRGRTKAARERI